MIRYIRLDIDLLRSLLRAKENTHTHTPLQLDTAPPLRMRHHINGEEETAAPPLWDLRQ